MIASGERGVFSISSTPWLSWYLSARHYEAHQPAFAVDNGVDLRSSATVAHAVRLNFLPPFSADRRAVKL